MIVEVWNICCIIDIIRAVCTIVIVYISIELVKILFSGCTEVYLPHVIRNSLQIPTYKCALTKITSC